MGKLSLYFILLTGGLVQGARAQSDKAINLHLYERLPRMEHEAFIHLCDSFLLLYPHLTHDICTYRLKAHYDNSLLADALYDLQVMDLNPPKRSRSMVNVSQIRNVLGPISTDYLQAEQYFRQGYYPECDPLLNEIHTKCVFFWQTHAMLSQCLDSMNLQDSAMEAIEYGISKTSSPHLYAARVQKYYDRKNLFLAFTDASYLINGEYDDPHVFYLRSKMYLEKGQLKEAMQDMQKANSLSPGNTAYMMHNARLYFYSAEHEVAYALYSNALKRGQVPDSIDAQLYLYCNLRQEHPNVDGINQMTSFHPDNPILYQIILESLYGYPDTTLFYLDRAIEKFPNETPFYVARSGIKREKYPNDPQIKKDYYTLIDLNPDTLYWYQELYLYTRFRNPKESKEIASRAQVNMQKVVARDSSRADYWYQLGEAYFMDEFYMASPEEVRNAKICFTRCIEKDPANYHAYYKRAQVENWGNRDMEAYLRDMRMALSLNEFWQYRHAMALELSYKKRNKEALEEISRAIELYPDLALLYETRASFYDKAGNPDLAKKDRKKAEELNAACNNCQPPSK